MNAKIILLIIVIFIFSWGFLNAQIISLGWNTFLGSGDADLGYPIVVDNSGNIYVAGRSTQTWGSPINAHSGNNDVFVACLDSKGILIWNTFIGGTAQDYGKAIALDSSGNVYVTGDSNSTWGSPVNAHSGGDDAFIACLNSSGNLLWSTFLGSASDDYGRGIVLDSSDNIYICGSSYATWKSPINAHSGSADIFVACLNISGNLIWNTFLGSTDNDHGESITLDSSDNIHVAGYSYATWGSPVNAFSGGLHDAFLSCLNSSGNLLWNTFLGSTGDDSIFEIIVDNYDNIYSIGYSNATWGSPINAYTGDYDAFVARLDNSGNLQWNTFLGSTNMDFGIDITIITSANIIYAAGRSYSSWGYPLYGFSGGCDAFVTSLDSSGYLLWNLFLGSTENDYGDGIALDRNGNIYLSGASYATWGTPINPHNGSSDAFVARILFLPIPVVKANGSSEPIAISQTDPLQIRIILYSMGLTADADWWLAYKGPSGWYHFDYSKKKWLLGLKVTHQGPLFSVSNKKVFQSSGLAPGVYTFYFGVDMVMDGKLTKSELYYDEVKVTVTQ